MNEKELLELLEDNRNLLQKNQDVIESLISQNKELSEENKTWKMISESEDHVDMSEVAKMINYKGYGRNKLFQFLRDNEILRYNNQPYQKYVDNSYFKIIEQKVELPYGEIKINLKTVATQKGVDFIRRQLDDYANK